MTIHSRLWYLAVPGVAIVAGTVIAVRVTKNRLTDNRTVSAALELTSHHRGGNGSPLLLLHGVGSIWRAWSPVLPYLDEHHDVIVPTLAGHGGAAALDPLHPPSINALADSIEAQLDELGIDRLHIAGNSLGGWLGIELARRGRALSLVLFSPAGAWRSQRSIEMRSAAIGFSVGALSRYSARADLLSTNAALRWLMVAPQVAYPSRFPADILAASIRASAMSPVVAPLLREIIRGQVEPLPADRDYPVRLVWGNEDRVLPYAGFGEPMLRRLPGAELVRVAGFGHVPMTDDPARVARLILDVTSIVEDNLHAEQTGSDG
ncbi:alpha/beta fold hydrolase [Mycolicibacterium hodleri]|uniref:Alpha/beta fold hydrolase n=1 Tax=Mycolicibacterium hodleri TaxID=49897 RepID=A0A502EHI1_9MYCO|nr:alpha/beta fold hydrolase [Mycolicibacterium hodleri]TPG36482.1 alpha/beta fold hydrolase [Mycolicibacterium hodleri]